MLLDSCVWIPVDGSGIVCIPLHNLLMMKQEFFLLHFSYFCYIKYMQYACIINIFLTTTWLTVILADVIVHVILSDVFWKETKAITHMV